MREQSGGRGRTEAASLFCAVPIGRSWGWSRDHVCDRARSRVSRISRLWGSEMRLLTTRGRRGDEATEPRSLQRRDRGIKKDPGTRRSRGSSMLEGCLTMRGAASVLCARGGSRRSAAEIAWLSPRSFRPEDAGRIPGSRRGRRGRGEGPRPGFSWPAISTSR